MKSTIFVGGKKNTPMNSASFVMGGRSFSGRWDVLVYGYNVGPPSDVNVGL